MVSVILYILGILLALFVILYVIGRIYLPSSVYREHPEQQNPMEGKRVRLVAEENGQKNADGVCGELEAIGDSVAPRGIYVRVIKRVLDILLSFFGLIILSPVFLVLAIAIYADDPGPVIFTQKRIGRNKQYFKLHKFRSMRMSTPHDIPTHMLSLASQSITKVGGFIRAHSLDELPQLWDIFIGNMSVVGPRPSLWNQYLLIAERDKYGANDVRPGLTGLAQIGGRDELKIEDKARLDGEYVKRLSFVTDAKCFFGSIHVIRNDNSVIEGAVTTGIEEFEMHDSTN